ncbi:unnamed protein product [Cylindrotheca closterium]|uniref:Cell division cycle protein 123 n=1 Tax=Cylindrotheca closterium TaxID=2856 RepID=A0AAD2G740_9STRA|nr:unnamed protein product [Cylindrotheca closterium]
MAEDEHNPVASMIDFTTNTEASPEETVPPLTGPFPLQTEVLACQMSSWYPTFSNLQHEETNESTSLTKKKRKNVTIATIILQGDSLPNDFQDYLTSDGVRLPLGATKLSSCAPNESKDNDDDGWSSDENDENSDGDDNNENDETDAPKQFHFPELNEQITAAVEDMGGAIIPKLNWSTPKDAGWVNGGSIKCQTPGDVYLLLKSSDFCLHDVLMQSLKECKDYCNDSTTDETTTTTQQLPPLQLSLRKWCTLYPSMEFRCFVRRHGLLAISQRNHTQHYPHLMQDWPQIQDVLVDFFYDYVRKQFADGTIENYVVDLYLDKKDRVWILDFNPWSQSTDSLLFEWSELLTMDDEEVDCDDDSGNDEELRLLPDFRIVETNQQVRQDPLASYRAPIDTIDLASMVGGDAKQFEEFMKQCQKPSEMQ